MTGFISEFYARQPIGAYRGHVPDTAQEHLPIHSREYVVSDGVYFSTDRLTREVDFDLTEEHFGPLDSQPMCLGLFWSD